MDKHINKIMRIRLRMSAHDKALAELRRQLRDAINAAVEEGGISLSEISRCLEVSRQRVFQLRATVRKGEHE